MTPPRLDPRSPGAAGLPVPSTYLVTDRRRLRPEARTLAGELAALEAWIDAAVEAGLDAVQIRERDLPVRALTDVAIACCRRAAGQATRILINDRIDVALASGAHGVHLRADGPPASRVRTAGWQATGENLIGRSVHTLDEVAAGQDADYLIFGPVFPTRSKPAGSPTAGLEGLRAAVTASRVPVLAIGGIDGTNARACLDAGAAGIAAIGLWMPGPDLGARVWAVREKR